MECKKCKKECLESELKDGLCKECQNEEVVKKEQKQEKEAKEQKQNSEEKPYYKKWWFWVLALFVLWGVILAVSNNEDTTNTQTTNTSNQTAASNLDENKLEENPYTITKDFDGTYTFLLTSYNGSGNTFTAMGAISFRDGICKIKYNKTSDLITTDSKIEYDGYCGLNEQDSNTFYFSIKDKNNTEKYTYKCTKANNDLKCELKSDFDLTGCTNNVLNLTYVDSAEVLDTTFLQLVEQEKAKKEAEEKAKKEQEEAEFKASCQTYTFEQMARNPENFRGTNVKLTGEVVQALYGTTGVDLRVNITKNGQYTTYYTDTIYVVYTPEEGEDKILENDIITIYGTSEGDYTYTSTLGASINLPLVYGKYIEIE